MHDIISFGQSNAFWQLLKNYQTVTKQAQNKILWLYLKLMQNFDNAINAGAVS